MNKTRRIAFGIGIVLTVLAVFTAPAMAYGWEAWLDPENSTGEYGGADVLVYINLTESVSESISGQVDLYYDKNCVNIVDVDQSMFPVLWADWRWYNDSYHGSMWMPWLSPTHTAVRMSWDNVLGPISAGDYTYAVLTLRCNCSSGCGSDLLYGYTEVNNDEGEPITGGHIFYNGTYTCTAPPETFSKPLVKGWNLISLPLTNATDMTVGNIINMSLSGSYDALYKYNASTHSFVLLSSSDTMENGIGYFIHMSTGDTWTYTGSAYTSMSIDLKKGLNMIGWLNCSKSIADTNLSSPSLDYYVASWNATAALPSFETFNPVAPDVFNDFDMMERGTGYFISAKADDTLEENCP